MAQKTITEMSEYDANSNVLVCLAHDPGLKAACDFFPIGTLNDWKKKGWKGSYHWGFLNEFPIDGKPGRPWLVPGLMKEGKDKNS